MSKREDYTNCMKPWMTGGGPDRKERFCIGAKVCSKGVNQEEAARLCAEAALNPKPPKVKRVRGGKIDTATLASCVIKNLDGAEITVANLTPIIASCTGQKARKAEPIEPVNKKEFLKQCYKDNPVQATSGTRAGFKEIKKLQSTCKARWEERGGGDN